MQVNAGERGAKDEHAIVVSRHDTHAARVFAATRRKLIARWRKPLVELADEIGARIVETVPGTVLVRVAH